MSSALFPAYSDLKLQNRASLVADLCEALRAGSSPLPRLKQEMSGLRGDDDERDFVAALYSALLPAAGDSRQ